MLIAVPRETHPLEQRVALTPDSAQKLQKLGYSLRIEQGAGEAASFSDDAYREAGVEVIEDVRQVYSGADLVLKVRGPAEHPTLGVHETELLDEGSRLISFLWPAQNEDLVARLNDRKITAMSMDMVPRISRAQKMDALSSMANIAGYRAVIEAANNFGRFFTGQITAAGKVPPAKVMVIGAGVAGLAAIGAAGSLGAIVRAFDTRPEVKEQVESMGAEFLELDYEEEEDAGAGDGYAKVMSEAFIKAEMELFARQAMDVDIIITTALIPGKPAPKLITEGMVESMKDGSVIVDLAAEQGGNCECTVPGEVAEKYGVKIIGYTDLPSRLPTQSSQLYATNLLHLLSDMTPEKDGELISDFEDEVVRNATVCKEGSITFPPPPIKVSAAPAPQAAVAAPPVAEAEPKKPNKWLKPVLMAGAAALFGWVANNAPADFLQHFTVFMLACVVGYYVVWNVTHALHTPLMSVTNAISGIIIVGALVQITASASGIVLFLAGIAVLIASINIAGGFAVTQRMLKMFQKDDS